MKKLLRNFKYKMEYFYRKNLSVNKREDYIAKLYKRRIGHTLEWNRLESYTEKMQFSKLYDVNSKKIKLSDKVEVKKWVADKVGEQYVIPTLGVFYKAEDINYELLPKKFVIKTNNASGTNIIITDKDKVNKDKINKKLNNWLKEDFAFKSFFEMHYSHIKPKILIEEYIETNNNDLQDYKFLCFNSKVEYCWLDIGRYSNHKRNIYNTKWELQNFNQYNYGNTKYEVLKPKNYDKMLEIAEILCQGFEHVRVDLYNVDGKIYFGEMTFTNGSGFERIYPDEYDRILGGLWKMSKDN